MAKLAQARRQETNAEKSTTARGVPDDVASCHSGDHGAHAGHEAPGAGAMDPVCGMTVDPHATAHRHPFEGRTYYFCSAGCRSKFAADPAKYLGAPVGAPFDPLSLDLKDRGRDP